MRKSILLISLLLIGCRATLPMNEGEPAQISDVVGAIKADIAEYQKYDATHMHDKPLDNSCNGAIGFSIESVKVSLTTKTDNSISGKGSATLPVGSSGISFEPSAGVTRQHQGTQTLTFSLFPKEYSASEIFNAATVSIDSTKFPIAAALQRLRDDLLKASNREPCISLIPVKANTKDEGGSFAFGFSVINQATAGGTLKFVVFSLGVSGTTQIQASNTITVIFRAKSDGAAGFAPN